MQKLFIDFTPGESLTLDGEQARHIAKSLRMKVGDMLTVTDGSGQDFGCMIEKITPETVELQVCYKQATDSEPDCKVTIYQGVPKSTKLEDIPKMYRARSRKNRAYAYQKMRIPSRRKVG